MKCFGEVLIFLIIFKRLLQLYEDGVHVILEKLLEESGWYLERIQKEEMREDFQRILPNLKETLSFIKSSKISSTPESMLYRVKIMVTEPDLSELCINNRSASNDCLQLYFPLSGVGRVALADLQSAVCDNNINYFNLVHQLLLIHLEERDDIKRYMSMVTDVSIGFSPLYIAVLCNRREISQEIVAFLKELVRTNGVGQRELDSICTEENGCLYRAYFDLGHERPNRNYPLSEKQKCDSYKLIEECTSEITEADNFKVNWMTNRFVRKMSLDNRSLPNQVPYLTFKQNVPQKPYASSKPTRLLKNSTCFGNRPTL